MQNSSDIAAPIAAANATPRLSLAALRRTSPISHGVTRAMRLSETEHMSRGNTPRRITMEDLTARPRSNPRSRTPMRYESPLTAEFRRESLELDNPATTEAPRRITIRPLVGNTAGTTISTRIHENRSVTPKSCKQGSSHRKVRRWDNDHFGSLATEISSSSRAVASVLMKAQQDAHLYKDIYDPKERESQVFNKFMTESKYQVARQRFLDGEILVADDQKRQSRHSNVEKELTPTTMLHRIDARLRRVVMKAAANSQPAFLVLKRFEDTVVRAFAGEGPMESDMFLDLLLEPPLVFPHSDGLYNYKFYFHAESPTGGFHRLLLHAICQFHGLHVTSKTADVQIGDETRARLLNVTGAIDPTANAFRLINCIGAATDGAVDDEA